MLGSPSTDDRRTAYVELSNNLRAGVTVLWDAFKTYFTIAGLLFAGAGFLLSSQSPFAPTFSRWAVLVISIAGVVITVLAGYGVSRILAYQYAFIARGLALEASMKTGVFRVSSRVWRAPKFLGSDQLTCFVFILFAAAWVLLGAFCVTCLLHSSKCAPPASSCSCACQLPPGSTADSGTPASPRSGEAGIHCSKP